MTDSFVGIDIGKYKFDVAVLSQQRMSRYRNFPNSPEGFKNLFKWLSSELLQEAPHFCMEG